MKILKKIIVVVFILVVVLIVGKNFFVKIAVENGVKAVTGLPLTIDKLNIGLLSSHIGIEGLSLMNPKGFPDEAMFHAPEIFVDYKIGSLISGNVHLEDIKLHFDRFVIVTNADGTSNLDVLKDKAMELKDKGGSKPADGKKDEKDKKAPEIQIDHLALKVGKVVYKDYSRGGDPVIKEDVINYSREFTNAPPIPVLMTIIIPEILLKAGLNKMLNFDIDTLKDTPGQVVDTLKNTADSLKNTLKLPFGN